MEKDKNEEFSLNGGGAMDAAEILMTIDSLCSLDNGGMVNQFFEENFNRDGSLDIRLEKQGYRDEQIQEIKMGISKQLPVGHYAKECYNWMQMREIRQGLMDEVDTTIYETPLYSSEQMREIRLGLMAGIDVASYSSLMYTAKDMEKKRKKLLQEEYRTNPTGFARECVDEDNGLMLRISDDCMEAFITISGDCDISMLDIRRFLTRNDVVFGIMDKKLEDILKHRHFGVEIKIAQGQKEKPGTDGRYKYYFNPLLPGTPTEMEDGSVDYTSVVEADMKMAGDLLAQYYPAVPGKQGRTVTGIAIQGKPGRELQPFVGNGFVRKEDNTYVAIQDGYVLSDEIRGVMNVWNIYVVQGDVNRYNGNIKYDGIIHIKGAVGDMAVIEAKGNIVVDGMAGSATLKAGGNIILKGGIHGGGKGVIHAGGKVMGKYFQEINIHATGDVEGNYFMNCFVETDGRVIAKGSKGRIMGGNMQALNGVEATIIGNYNSNKTIIDVGNTTQIDGRRHRTMTKINKLDDELCQLEEGKEKLKLMLGESLCDTNELFRKTCYAIQVIEEQKKELNDEIAYFDLLIRRALKARLVVHGNIQEGVVVFVNNKPKDMEKMIRRK